MNFRFLLFFFSLFSFAQTSYPDQVMDCQYSRYSDNGKHIKAAISDYENWLINNELLEDHNPRSFKSMIHSLASSSTITQFPSFTQFLYKNEFASKNLIESKACEAELRNSMPDWFKDKFQKLQKIISTIKFDTKTQQVFLKLDELLEVEDFKHDYYKLQLFSIMNIMTFTEGIELIEYDIDTLNSDEVKDCVSISILLNAENLIVHENTGNVITIEEFKTQLKEHIETNNENACFILKASESASYKKYLSIVETSNKTLLEVRNNASTKKYGKLFNELDESQKREIRVKYPKRFIEQEY